MNKELPISETENYNVIQEQEVSFADDNTTIRKRKWDEAAQSIEAVGDRLGLGIDNGIKRSVVALNVLGISTRQSCEGHTNEGRSYPWVSIAAPNEPDERFVHQEAVFGRIAQKYNMSIEEVKAADNPDAYWEAVTEFSENEETKEYVSWEDENKRLLYTTRLFLDDFYKNREVAENLKIRMDWDEIYSGDTGGRKSFEEYEYLSSLSEQQKSDLNLRLIEYRNEMDVFASFLKENFLREGDKYGEDKRKKAQEMLDQEKIAIIRNQTDFQ